METDRPLGTSAAGKWIRATVRSDVAAMRRTEEAAVGAEITSLVEIAFQLMVHRRFAAGCERAEITRHVLGIRQRYGAAKAGPVIDAEMVIRRELGESVPIDDLDDSVVLRLKMLILEQLVHDMGMFDDELDELVQAAEAEAHGST
jgi:hypothetical protein